MILSGMEETSKETEIYTALGLMSGTSLDGVDVALIRTDGRSFVEPIASSYMPYQPDLKAKIRACFGRTEADDETRDAEREVTLAHADAVRFFMDKEEWETGQIDVIGFHGQTITHKPKEGFTWQLGDGALLARETGINVVNDFRVADVGAGGEGAPLIPLFHQALARAKNVEFPCVVLNIGGVANVTWIGERQDDILAFDTGPGNALMDDLMFSAFGQEFDFNGEKAKSGTPRADMVARWMAHDYLNRKPPKSLDRGFLPQKDETRTNADLNVFDVQNIWDLKPEDALATLGLFTVDAILAAEAHFPAPVKQWYVCGGGRHNNYLMDTLKEKIGVKVDPIDALNYNGDAIEAEGFAYLAARHLQNLPLSLPTTTGVRAPQTGGKFSPK